MAAHGIAYVNNYPLIPPSESHKAQTPSHYPRRTIPNPTIG